MTWNLAPEQVRREEVDKRSDLFSFGIVPYEMVTAHHPFPGPSSAGVLDAILHRTPQQPRQLNAKLPHKVDHVVMRALGKDHNAHYQSASEL